MTSQTPTDLQAHDALNARRQDSINGLREVRDIRDAILAAIDLELGQYPQYKDHGRDWGLGFIARTIRTKRGTAFRRGDVVLYHRDDDLGVDGYEFVAYSVRNGVDTALAAADVEALATAGGGRWPDGLVTFAL